MLYFHISSKYFLLSLETDPSIICVFNLQMFQDIPITLSILTSSLFPLRPGTYFAYSFNSPSLWRFVLWLTIGSVPVTIWLFGYGVFFERDPSSKPGLFVHSPKICWHGVTHSLPFLCLEPPGREEWWWGRGGRVRGPGRGGGGGPQRRRERLFEERPRGQHAPRPQRPLAWCPHSSGGTMALRLPEARRHHGPQDSRGPQLLPFLSNHCPPPPPKMFLRKFCWIVLKR